MSSAILCPRQTILPDWIDYNGHLNMAYYHVLFDRALDHVFDQLGIGEDYTRSGAGSAFTVQVHVNYLRELSLHDPVQVRFRLLDHDAKRMHFFEEMLHAEEGWLAATSEQMSLHVSMATRRSAPFPDAVIARLAELQEAHASLPRPPQVGSVIGIRRG
ncbi:MAG: thioesterase family protein [Pseudomonadales bacterium]